MNPVTLISVTKEDDLDGLLNSLESPDSFDVTKPLEISSHMLNKFLCDGAGYIHYALFMGAPKISEFCLSKVSGDVFDSNRRGLLLFAAASPDLSVYQMVESKLGITTQKDISGLSPAHVSAYFNSISVFQYLWMSQSKDLHATALGKTPLAFACTLMSITRSE